MVWRPWRSRVQDARKGYRCVLMMGRGPVERPEWESHGPKRSQDPWSCMGSQLSGQEWRATQEAMQLHRHKAGEHQHSCWPDPWGELAEVTSLKGK